MPPVGTTINTLRWEGRVGRSHEGGSREWPPVYMTDDPLSWEGRLTALAGQPLFIDYYTLRVHTNTPSCGQGSVNNCLVCNENIFEICQKTQNFPRVKDR